MTLLARKHRVTRKMLTTYSIGLLQAKASRVLNHYNQLYLAKFKITPVEWSFLGLLFDNPDGLTLRATAERMGVSAPFITRMVNSLIKRGWVRLEATTDARARCVLLSGTGLKQVPLIERELCRTMCSLIQDASMATIVGYVKILKMIIENGNLPTP